MSNLPTFQELEAAVNDAAKNAYFFGNHSLDHTFYLCKLFDSEPNPHKGNRPNSLSGMCTLYSGVIEEFLKKERNMQTQLMRSNYKGIHTLLKANTSDRGEILIDPTLGQFVKYFQVFMGTMDELKAIFMDPSRELLCGTRIWAVDHDITTREEWFDLLYNIGEVAS
ncbi:hypothetical protein HZA97_08425 [Candidatus Woesearchaeota archaeon]|nr:hypothetical protein [Candidatus Woesearchaeota archaeon]